MADIDDARPHRMGWSACRCGYVSTVVVDVRAPLNKLECLGCGEMSGVFYAEEPKLAELVSLNVERMKEIRSEMQKHRACAPLLPDPGPEAVNAVLDLADQFAELAMPFELALPFIRDVWRLGYDPNTGFWPALRRHLSEDQWARVVAS